MRRLATSNRLLNSAISTQLRSIKVTNREALNAAIDEEMARDPTVFLMGEEVGQYNGAYKISKGLYDKYGGMRVMDTPITEHGFTGIAVGAALNGLRPIVEFMTMNFSLQAIDQIVNSAAKGLYMSGGQLKCPIVFRGASGASAGVGAQHSQCLAPWYASVPGLKVVAPYSAEDCRGLLKAAIRDPGPVVCLEHELTYGDSFEVSDADWANKDYLSPFKAKIERVGTDITIVAFSKAVGLSLAAAERLKADGICDAEVINLRSLRPLDRHTILASLQKTHRLVTVDESWPMCNIGAEICATVMEAPGGFDALDAPIERISCVDIPMPYAKNMESGPNGTQPQVEDIVEVCKRVCSRKKY